MTNYDQQLSKQLIAHGIEYQCKRMSQSDMLTTDQAAALIGVSRVTVNAWIRSTKVIAVQSFKRGYKLPRWQFEPWMHELVPQVAKALGSNDGWVLLSFFESGKGALNGASPLHALLTGAATQKAIIDLAIYEGH